MDTHTIQARFSSQEQAESAIRKLSSLRGDRFRLERESGGAAQTGMLAGGFTNAYDGLTGGMSAPENPGAAYGMGTEGDFGSAFTLSANVPTEAADQARSVIEGAGGSML